MVHGLRLKLGSLNTVPEIRVIHARRLIKYSFIAVYTRTQRLNRVHCFIGHYSSYLPIAQGFSLNATGDEN